LYGENGTGKLLILSQVILSVQLSFAVIPLIQFTGNKIKMEQFANSKVLHFIAWIIALIIISLNVYMLFNIVRGN
jgi:manganese transport protein